MTSFDINATLGPIIYGVVALMPTFLALITGMLPIILVVSVIGFILAFWDKILGMIKI
jgi:hypothetical protein